MSKLVCKHCKTELTLNNIKDIEFGRVYKTTELGEMDEEVAYIKCSKCDNITETDSETGYTLHYNLINARQIELLNNANKLYDFEDVRDLLDNLSDSDKEKVKDCQFKVFEQSPDDDSGNVYDHITIFKDGTEIGKIDMMCYLNTPHDIENTEELIFGELSYSYSYKMKLNNSQEHHIECPNCHNKILGKYWLNVKYQGHDNYGDYEEDIYTGECPVCGETIETSELELYTNSIEAEETELQQYYKVIGKLGYSPFPFEDCEYSETCAADELNYIKNALDDLTDTLNLHYLYNIYNTTAIQSNKMYSYYDEVIQNIFRNTSHVDFNIDSIKDCQFRVLDCSVLNDEVGDDVFDTPTINLLLQVVRNNKILGYIGVNQQYPLDKKFTMFEVKKESNKRLVELCKFYTSVYKDYAPKVKINSGFNTQVCKKCGQLFCDCNLRCPICGKVFCEHKYIK